MATVIGIAAVIIVLAVVIPALLVGDDGADRTQRDARKGQSGRVITVSAAGITLGTVGAIIANQQRRDYYRQNYYYGGNPYYGGRYYGSPGYYGSGYYNPY